MSYSAFLQFLRRFLICIFFFNMIPIYAVFEGFQPVVLYDGGNVAVAVGDFNNDGILDLATTNYELGNASILLGNGDGTFQNQIIFEVGTNPVAIAVGDFNNDGILDLTVVNSTDGTVSILLGNGDGTFQNQIIFEVGANPSGIAVGDFNNNGILDLAVINADDGTVSILLGNGDGTFQNQMIFEVGTNPSGIAVGDFNNDGILDLAVTNYDLGTVSILLGNGDGTFQNQIIFEVGTNPIAIAVGDFNNDGNLDLSVALYLNLANDPEGVSILLGNGDGTFQPAVFYPVVGFAQAIVTGDFNNDGILDLAVIDFNDTDYDFSILLGNGDGTFQPPFNTSIIASGSGIAAGDFNNDGKLDLVLVIPVEGPAIEIFIQKLDTLTTLSANPSHAIEGQPVNLIAIVAPASATGTVTFTEGTTILGTVPLADGEAVFTTSSLSLGVHLITATYSGDINFSSSEGLVSVDVQTTSITALSISPNPTYTGQNTNLTALVTPASATGTVTFTTGSTILGTAPLLNGVATLTINTLSAGTYIILANYNGDSNFLGSASAALTLVVQPAIKPVILPPQHLKGSKKTTLFATQTDYINILKWQAPRSGSKPITYHIYRDSQLTELVAVIQANQALKYYDHNRKKRKLYTYYVISIDPLGNQSAAVSVTIRG